MPQRGRCSAWSNSPANFPRAFRASGSDYRAAGPTTEWAIRGPQTRPVRGLALVDEVLKAALSS